MGVTPGYWVRGAVLAVAAGLALAVPGRALEQVNFALRGGDADLQAALRGASGVLAAQSEGVQDAQDLFATARAEYARLLGALYAKGHYSATIEVRIDGREAANIAPLDAPRSIRKIDLRVTAGPAFAFSQARIAPLAAKTELPPTFAIGRTAESGVIREAAQVAVERWRSLGHAKADVTGQDLTADHARATLAADMQVSPGPRLRFGRLQVSGAERMRVNRILKIAGLPEGKTYDPQELRDAAERLRRSGVFKSVTLVEDDQITAPDLLGITAQLVEEKTRRYSYGVEIASSEGAKIAGYWMHRNLMGGGERLRVDASIAQIGARDSGADYFLGVTLDRPATLTRDTTASFKFGIGQTNETDYSENFGVIGLGLTHFINKRLTGRAGIEYGYSNVTDIIRNRSYRNLSLPIGLLWDNRNSKTDATRGYYLDVEAKPFLGFGTTDSGLRGKVDARAYYGFGEADRITLAGRVQLGAIYNASLIGTPRDFLFYSGGGGTVRGQPYQSLGVNVLRNNFRTGGTEFAAVSAELRTKITDTIGVVGFVDVGYVGIQGANFGDSHSGAGLGLRYATGFGPIRVDIARPMSGRTGKGMQIYIGIGQAF